MRGGCTDLILQILTQKNEPVLIILHPGHLYNSYQLITLKLMYIVQDDCLTEQSPFFPLHFLSWYVCTEVLDSEMAFCQCINLSLTSLIQKRKLALRHCWCSKLRSLQFTGKAFGFLVALNCDCFKIMLVRIASVTHHSF